MEWNYQILQAQVADWLGRTDLTEKIPVFIDLAERRMNAELRLRIMERRSTTRANARDAALPLPARRVDGDWDVYLNMREVALVEEADAGYFKQGQNLRFVAPDVFTGLSSELGRPEAYTIIGDEILFAPVPKAEYLVLMSYYAEIQPLSDIQSTNELLVTNPLLYLYATLVESAPYTRTSAPLEMWIQYYESAKLAAMESDRKARFSRQIEARSPRRLA